MRRFDSWAEESAPGATENAVLRGSALELVPWLMHEAGGSFQPFGQSVDDEVGVLEWLNEKELIPNCAAPAVQVWKRFFARGHSARATQRYRSTAVAASDGRVGALPASNETTGR